MGLYLIRQVVQTLHMNIHVESSPGEGTTFTLPFREKTTSCILQACDNNVTCFLVLFGESQDNTAHSAYDIDMSILQKI